MKTSVKKVSVKKNVGSKEVLNTVAKVIESNEKSFNGRKNTLYRILKADSLQTSTQYEKDVLNEVNTAIDSLKASTKVNKSVQNAFDVIFKAKKSKESAKFNNLLLSATEFTLTVKIDKEENVTYLVTYSFKSVLFGANKVNKELSKEQKLSDVLQCKVFNADMLNDKIKRYKKTLKKTNEKLNSIVTDIAKEKSEKALEYMRAEKSNLLTSIQKTTLAISYCETELKALQQKN